MRNIVQVNFDAFQSELFEKHWWALPAFSTLLFIISIALVPIVIVSMPADYYSKNVTPRLRAHSLYEIMLLVVKNIFGWLMILAGLAMLVLPGQGILTILLGLTFINFPGKRNLELHVVAKPKIARALNWLRKKAGRPPFVI